MLHSQVYRPGFTSTETGHVVMPEKPPQAGSFAEISAYLKKRPVINVTCGASPQITLLRGSLLIPCKSESCTCILTGLLLCVYTLPKSASLRPVVQTHASNVS